MFAQRSSGILLHPTSLPSRGGIGDLGPAAYEFADWLAAARQTLWQILPLQPAGCGNSPYSCTSAFAGNILLISLERLVEAGLLVRGALATIPDGESPVDFDRVRAYKLPLLRQAASNFLRSANVTARRRYERFCRENEWWLEDYVLFSVLRERFGGKAWNEWPRALALRESAAIGRARSELQKQLDEERFLQFAFFEQWQALRCYCADRGIRVIGDVSIFVSYDSADVWTHPELFHLREDRSPAVVAGVPPDAFSETGQRWGNPIYDWRALESQGYDWWIRRMRWATVTCDIVRIDHFRGFEAYWEIPAEKATAVHGRWVPGPNEKIFQALRSALGKLPFIAEDLGYITREVHELRKRLKIPGMKILQFGFGNRGAHIYLPHNYEPNCVVYTGTHDNDTTVGWWNTCATEEEKKLATTYLGIGDEGVHWAFIRAALTSVADLCVIPVQDVLGLDSSARMNVPSETDGSWGWRLRPGALTPELAAKLAALVEISDRDACVRQPSLNCQQRDRETGEDFAA
ncbi:MAG TPA: 4-alpha-glucanotransferase [Candidatus Binatia bacterium]|nr:4-alpha-glucanotransferase [Candidatus Binatia bacterium]